MRFIDQVRVPIPAKTEHIRRKYLDLSYDEGFYRRKLDIYLPNEGEGPFPVIVDIHGGGWYFGDKSEHKLDPALHLLDRGYAVVSVGYSLSWMKKLPTQVFEVKAAIRYLRAHADEYHLDGKHIALWGESSGSHYAALTACSASAHELFNTEIGGNAEQSDEVQAVIGWFTPTNLGRIPEQLWVCGQDVPAEDNTAPDSPPGVILGASPQDVPELVRVCDPNTYINKNTPPYYNYLLTLPDHTKILIWGGEASPECIRRAGHYDPDISIVQIPREGARAIADLYKAVGGKVIFPHHHETILDLEGGPDLISDMLDLVHREAPGTKVICPRKGVWYRIGMQIHEEA